MMFARDGAQKFPRAAAADLLQLGEAVAHLPFDEAGSRIRGIDALAPFLSNDGCVGRIAAAILGPQAKPVRAIFFNKTAANNWSLAWHQDRTICVREPRSVTGFGPWTIKRGMHHVAPPFDVLSRMVTLRVHFDPVDEGNAPLLIATGSHLSGRVPVEEIDAVVRQSGIHVCLAEAGDIWLYSTPILHASEAAATPVSRRVLQADYAAEVLPGGLEWLGV